MGANRTFLNFLNSNQIFIIIVLGIVIVPPCSDATFYQVFKICHQTRLVCPITDIFGKSRQRYKACSPFACGRSHLLMQLLTNRDTGLGVLFVLLQRAAVIANASSKWAQMVAEACRCTPLQPSQSYQSYLVGESRAGPRRLCSRILHFDSDVDAQRKSPPPPPTHRRHHTVCLDTHMGLTACYFPPQRAIISTCLDIFRAQCVHCYCVCNHEATVRLHWNTPLQSHTSAAQASVNTHAADHPEVGRNKTMISVVSPLLPSQPFSHSTA